MDLLCWYVLLWWLQRPIQSLGSFHWTVTQQLLCFTKTFRRWLFTQQTPPNCKPANPCGPPGIRAESNKKALDPNMRVFTGGSGICISHSCSECVFFFYFFFFWVILLRIHIFLSPREVQNRGSGEWGGVLVTLWFLRQNPDFLWCVSKQRGQSRRRCPLRAAKRRFDFCPVSFHNFPFFSVFYVRQNVLWIPSSCNVL